MRTIHKFQFIKDESPETIATARILKILHVAYQNEVLCVWAEVDMSYAQMTKFYVLGTGRDVPDNLVHCGTVFSISGIFVWHIYIDRACLHDSEVR